MMIDVHGFAIDLTLAILCDGAWITPPSRPTPHGLAIEHQGLTAELALEPQDDRVRYHATFASPFPTRLRIGCRLQNQSDLFHLIPGNIHGDNNAAHVRPGEFPCLTSAAGPKNFATLWEFRADRASHPVSILCCRQGAVGISINPYSANDQSPDGIIRNGLFAALPDTFGVSLGYGNDPLTFIEKTSFSAPTANLSRTASATGAIWAVAGAGRLAAHRIIRSNYDRTRDLPAFTRAYPDALAALAESFIKVNWSPDLAQYTNRKCQVPTDTTLRPWRAIVEIGWTGGAMLAYPFILAERLLPDLRFPKTGRQIFDQICTGFNDASGLINDTCLNGFTQNRPQGWNASTVNGWWSGFLPNTQDNHCAYTNAHAAYYLLRTANPQPRWIDTALAVLDTAVDLQREDGQFGYLFSSHQKKVIDWDGFAGCWFVPGLILAWKLTQTTRYHDAAARAMDYYWPFVRQLTCWGTPMDTYKSIDSEGNLAFVRAARLLHEATAEPRYLEMLRDGAHYEYLWRYGFRTRPECPPLKGSNWNSCGGSLTSVSNPHIHPMSVVITEDLKYLSRQTGDPYHDRRADDGLAWLMNTMELYPDTMGYGQYGVLSERTCPSDGLLAEKYSDGSSASTWWSYNAWAAASAMEAIAERMLAEQK